jgi:flagellar biosynthesis GTPase FlhF
MWKWDRCVDSYIERGGAKARSGPPLRDLMVEIDYNTRNILEVKKIRKAVIIQLPEKRSWMRQSTLGFGRGKSDPEERVDDVDAREDAPAPVKRARRQAATKSEESSKKQMQMTIALDGKLHRQEREALQLQREIIDVDEVAEEVSYDKIKPTKKRKEVPVLSATSKPTESISLSVKGNLGDASTSHSFFAKRLATKSIDKTDGPLLNGVERAAPLKQKFQQLLDTPWPDARNIHVQPDGSMVQVRPQAIQSSLCSRRVIHASSKSENVDCSYGFLTEVSPIASTSYRPAGIVGGTRSAVVQNFIGESIGLAECSRTGTVPAAITRLLKEALDVAPVQKTGLWVDSYRPMKAQEVLGNESRSTYLRDWLEDLRLTGIFAGEREVKKIERRKKKLKRTAGMDDFIVDDDEEEQAWFDQFRKRTQSEDDLNTDSLLTSLNGTNKEEGRRHLTNAIVLSGPTGSGKTAAVYACAAELGFEVFEVYAGFGKRSGKEVSQAVGDLGRNHMVSSGGVGGGATWKGSKANASSGVKGAPRQSLILLEEVDLLFEEDKGFWSAVVELVSSSRRPVVMTCNGESCTGV